MYQPEETAWVKSPASRRRGRLAGLKKAQWGWDGALAPGG